MRKQFTRALESVEIGGIALTPEQTAAAAAAVAAAQPQAVPVTIELDPTQQAAVVAAAAAAPAAAPAEAAPAAEAPAAEAAPAPEGGEAEAIAAAAETPAAVDGAAAEVPAAETPAAETPAEAAATETPAAEVPAEEAPAGEAAAAEAPTDAEAADVAAAEAAAAAPAEGGEAAAAAEGGEGGEATPAADDQGLDAAHAEHDTAAQQHEEATAAIDADAENISLEEEALFIDEAGQAAAQSGADLEEATRCMEVSDALEDLAVITDEITEASPQELALIENAGSLAVAGTDVGPEEIVPALEAFGGKKIDTAHIKKTAKAIWDSIQRFIKQIWEQIQKFFYNTLGTIPALRRRLKELAAEAHQMGNKTANKKSLKFNSGSRALSIGINTVKNEAQISKGLGDLIDAGNFIYGTWADSVAKRGDAIGEAIASFNPEKPKDSAVGLVQKLRANTGYSVPGGVQNKSRFPGFDAQEGPDLLGGVQLVAKRFTGTGDASVLATLDRYRHSGITLEPVSTNDGPDREYEIQTITPSAAGDLIKDCEKLLDVLEQYNRGGRSKAIESTRKRVDAASEKASLMLEGTAQPETEAVHIYRGLLNFNASYAGWARNPAVPFMGSSLATIRAVMLVIRKSMTAYGIKEEKKTDDGKEGKTAKA